MGGMCLLAWPMEVVGYWWWAGRIFLRKRGLSSVCARKAGSARWIRGPAGEREEMSGSRELRQLEKAKSKAQKTRNLKEEATICNQLGEILAKNGHFREAIEEHRQELHIFEGLCDLIGCAVANRRIGECFAELGNYEAALKRALLSRWKLMSREFQALLPLSDVAKDSLYWWLSLDHLLQGVDFEIPQWVIITTDASLSGWGA
ncbi:uncharacterized protein LOC115082575, partial [Rhinatrema bivittatum]|uniref:uncharacterized protein LOC115082575 n=1 Tax=Rhinatrema bivittatum TaxID=194408 RepID=UPI00112C1971